MFSTLSPPKEILSQLGNIKKECPLININNNKKGESKWNGTQQQELLENWE